MTTLFRITSKLGVKFIVMVKKSSITTKRARRITKQRFIFLFG